MREGSSKGKGGVGRDTIRSCISVGLRIGLGLRIQQIIGVITCWADPMMAM